jgi:protoporphyrinogen oxidase
MGSREAVIIGAGPAGLTAAFELLQKSDIKPVVYESTGHVGGISKTLNYKGNRLDVGGHRFFSKSDKVMQWWLDMLPQQGAPARDDILLQREVPLSREPGAPDPEKSDKVMLSRTRLSRIFFLRRFFDYPISLKKQTFLNLGPKRVFKVGVSYVRATLFPIREEKSLEDFFINRFGRELYQIFFKDYTEKVWGVSCKQIYPEWGAQRVKGLSIRKALLHAARKMVTKDDTIYQKNTETSLIERFMYPKYGPGQMWEEVARRIQDRGGEIHLHHKVIGLNSGDGRVQQVRIQNTHTGGGTVRRADYFLSTMPVKDLIVSWEGDVPSAVKEVALGLVYRDFMGVCLLLRKLKIKNETNIKTINNIIPDNWIYVQERDVKLGRVQIYNNWSPYMVKDENTVWVGLEYFCNEGDQLWNRPDEEVAAFAIEEAAKIGMIDEEEVLDHVVIREPKAYPAYLGTYNEFYVIKEFLSHFDNLFLIGRNGMHRYNNTDHSMLTAMIAVENLVNGAKGKENIWSVNTEEEYHEQG